MKDIFDGMDLDKLVENSIKDVLKEIYGDPRGEAQRQKDISSQIKDQDLKASEKAEKDKLKDKKNEQEEVEIDTVVKVSEEETKDRTVKVSYDYVVEQLNLIRSGKSLTSPEIAEQLEIYFNRLSKGDRIALDVRLPSDKPFNLEITRTTDADYVDRFKPDEVGNKPIVVGGM
jgi:hypothetical protein